MVTQNYIISMDNTFINQDEYQDVHFSETVDFEKITDESIVYIDIKHPVIMQSQLSKLVDNKKIIFITKYNLLRDTIIRLKKEGINIISKEEMNKRIRLLGEKFDSKESSEFAAIIRNVPSFEGKIKNGEWVNIITAIHENRMDCNLYLKKGKIKKVITFYKGFPVFVKSNRAKELLGRMLVDEKQITKEQCKESLNKMKKEKILQGQAFIRMGVLTEQELHEALARQWGLKLLDVFYWDEGHYVIKQNKAKPPKFIPPFTFGELIITGLRGLAPGLLKASVNRILSYYPIPHPIPELRYQPLPPNINREKFSQLDGRITLTEFIGDNESEQDEIYLTIASLLLSGNYTLSKEPLPVPMSFIGPTTDENETVFFPSKLITELEEEWNINNGLEPGRKEYWLRKIHSERFLAEPYEVQQKSEEWFQKILSFKSYPIMDSGNIVTFNIGWNKNYE